jgi:hypothetical protein
MSEKATPAAGRSAGALRLRRHLLNSVSPLAINLHQAARAWTERACAMGRVILESPYAGDVDQNVAYARACIRDCLQRGEAPIASHLLFTQPGVLRDEMPEERALGIAAGLAWLPVAETLVAYIDRGISPGMAAAIELAERAGIPVERRSLLAKGAADA